MTESTHPREILFRRTSLRIGEARNSFLGQVSSVTLGAADAKLDVAVTTDAGPAKARMMLFPSSLLALHDSGAS